MGLMNGLSEEEARELAEFLGIPSEGISPDSLRGLIAATIKDGKPKAGPSALDPGILLDHFENQRLTDCGIRVRLNQPSIDLQRMIKPGVPPPPARKRTMSIGGMGKTQQQQVAMPVPELEADVRMIKAHNIILSSRSRYFEKALQKAGPEKIVDVTLVDEEDFRTLRLLVKLSYGTTYTKEGERRLEPEELIRMAYMAKSFEFTDAVRECCLALQGRMNFERSVQVMELGSNLEGGPHMEALLRGANDVFLRGIGPVHELWTSASPKEDPLSIVGMRLKDQIRDLNPDVFELMLSNPGLELQSENEAFWLLKSWVESQALNEQAKQALFQRMAKHLRFFDMTPEYLLLVVVEDPRVQRAGLQMSILSEALARMRITKATADERESLARYAPPLMESRIKSGRTLWNIRGTFTIKDIAEASISGNVEKVADLVAGFPWSIKLERKRTKDGEPDTVGLYTGFPAGFIVKKEAANQVYGFFVRIKMTAAPDTAVAYSIGNDKIPYWLGGNKFGCVGFHKMFEQPWEVVFGIDSPYLRDGQLDVEVNLNIS